MASGPPNNQQGPRRKRSRPSIVHSFTQQDEETLHEQERIIEAHYEWIWPDLEPLWNPKSRVHWMKNISILQDFQNSRGKNDPLSATILLSAARHGDAMLRESNALRELVMESFCHPLNPGAWDKAKKIPDSFWKGDFVRHVYPWRPLNYYKTIAKIDIERSLVKQKLQGLGEPGNSIPKRLSIEESRPLRYLEKLFRKHLNEQDCRKVQSHSFKIHVLSCELDIDLEPIRRKAARESECPICRETLLDHEDVYKSICEAARKRIVQVPCMSMKLAHAGYSAKVLEEEAQDRNCYPLAYLYIDADLDASWFLKCLLDSYDALKKMIEEPKCVQAVSLRCSHTMGLDCIEEWILFEKSTCPICRARLRVTRSAPDPPPRRGRDIAMIDPGDGGPLEEAIVVEQPLNEDRPEEAIVVDQWDRPIYEEVGSLRSFMNSRTAQEGISRIMGPMLVGQHMEAPPRSSSEPYPALVTDSGPQDLRLFDRNRRVAEASTINRQQLVERDNNGVGNIPRPVYNFRDSRVESRIEGENLSSQASEILDPNPVSLLRQSSTETLLGYVWEEGSGTVGTEVSIVPGDEIWFRGPRNAANEEPPYTSLSSFPTPSTSDDQEEAQERVFYCRRSQRNAILDSDVDVTRQDQPNRRERT